MKAIEVLEQARQSGIKVTEDRSDPRYPSITFSWQGGSIAAMEIVDPEKYRFSATLPRTMNFEVNHV